MRRNPSNSSLSSVQLPLQISFVDRRLHPQGVEITSTVRGRLRHRSYASEEPTPNPDDCIRGANAHTVTRTSRQQPR